MLIMIKMRLMMMRRTIMTMMMIAMMTMMKMMEKIGGRHSGEKMSTNLIQINESKVKPICQPIQRHRMTRPFNTVQLKAFWGGIKSNSFAISCWILISLLSITTLLPLHPSNTFHWVGGGGVLK